MAKKKGGNEPSENILSDMTAETEDIFDAAFAGGTAGVSSEKVSESEENAGTTGEVITEGTDGTQGQVTPKEDLSAAGTSGEDYKQQWSTAQGIIKQERAEKEALQGKIDDLQRKQTEIERLQEGTKAEKVKAEKKKGELAEFLLKLYDDLPDEEKAELSKYDEEFDVVSKSETKKRTLFAKKIAAYIDEAIETSNKSLLTNLAPFLMASEKTSEESHFAAIKSTHPDFEKYRDDGSLKSWISKQPTYLRSAMQKTYEEGEAQDVVDLYSRFKKDNNIGTTQDNKNQAIDDETKRKLDSQEIVDSGKKAIKSQGGVGKKDDYEGAFDEAAAAAGLK
jgi:hypothetical protein